MRVNYLRCGCRFGLGGFLSGSRFFLSLALLFGFLLRSLRLHLLGQFVHFFRFAPLTLCFQFVFLADTFFFFLFAPFFFVFFLGF